MNFKDFNTSEENAQLAVSQIGDGKEPNKFFISVSNTIRIDPDLTDGEEIHQVNGHEAVEHTLAYMPSSFEEAVRYVDGITLDPHEEVTSIVIEDRKCGVIYERTLTKQLVTTYREQTENHSNLLN